MERESEQIILVGGKYEGEILSITEGMQFVVIPDPLTGGQWQYKRTSEIDKETGRTIFN